MVVCYYCNCPKEAFIYGKTKSCTSLLHSGCYGDEISALGDREEMVIGDDPIYSSIPLAAYSMAGALEAEDISAGHLALGASYVSNAFETALSTGYDDLKASNDTVII